MTNVIHVDDLIHDLPPTGYDEADRPSDDPLALIRWWCMILLMAVRDHATSIQYHPWREDGGLAYIVGGVRRVLEPPSERQTGAALDAAMSLFAAPLRGGSLDRLFRGTEAGATCVSVELDVRGDAILWDAVLWSSGERSGVELFRVAG